MKSGKKRKQVKQIMKSGKGKKIIKMKSRKMKEKRITQLDMIKKPWGGHLPFPPKNCARKEYVFTSVGVPWIDLGICIGCKDFPKGCDRKREYIAEMRRMQKEYFAKDKKGEKDNK